MKAEETRKIFIQELNAQFSGLGTFSGGLKEQKREGNVVSSTTLEKPKMFAPKAISTPISLDIQPIRGMGFKDTKVDKILPSVETEEIYDMQALIESNPEGMRTLSYDTKTIKAQMALVKKKEWLDVMFEDIQWTKSIDLVGGIKSMLKKKIKI